MKRIFQVTILVFVFFALSSCSRYSVLVLNDANYGAACPNPIYIATMSRTATNYNQEALTLASMLDEARTKYGSDVTIQNIRWDVATSNGKPTKVSAIYDVIKCK
jgi:hypothetical protein